MRKWAIVVASIAAALLADQLSKGWVLQNLALYETVQPLPALAPLFQLTRSSNTGAAFGLFPMAKDIFPLLALVISCGLFFFVRGRSAQERLVPFATGIILGGAWGNVLDRLQYGHVVDFIHYQIPGLVSNVSNIADHAILAGVILLLVELMWQGRQESEGSVAAAAGGD